LELKYRLFGWDGVSDKEFKNLVKLGVVKKSDDYDKHMNIIQQYEKLKKALVKYQNRYHDPTESPIDSPIYSPINSPTHSLNHSQTCSGS